MGRAGPEPGPPSLRFFGGPMDGESMIAMPGLPEIAVRPAACDDGFYVWHSHSARYEWLQVPPAHTAP